MNARTVLNLETASDSPHPLVDRAAQPDGTRIRLGPVDIGGRDFAVIAGPCAVEGRAELKRAARMVKAAGAPLLRAGAFKPRTSPYSFQGLGKDGLTILHECSHELNLPVVTEVMSPNDVPLVEQYADMLQVGARSMQNYALLTALGHARKPVLLKRGPAATIEEWLLAAEYILHAGNPQVILCERGIRTFEPMTRNTLDLNAVAAAKRLTHLPVLVDPSHGTGKRELVAPLALAALAVGADGIIVEAHPDPDAALSDGAQSLPAEGLNELMHDLRRLAPLHGRSLPTAASLSPDAQLSDGRRQIDDLDEALAALLQERVRVARSIGEAKRDCGQPLCNSRREAEVLAHVCDMRSGDMPAAALKHVFQCIIGETLRAQELDIA